MRTPKFGIAGASGTWRGKGYGDRAPWGGAVEVALGLYCAAATQLFWTGAHYAMVPFLALYTLGFLIVGGYTLAQSIAVRRRGRVPSWASPGWSLASARLGRVARPSLGRRLGGARRGRRALVESRRRALDQPVACATCHHDPDATRGWAASFPKVRPLPPPHTRVMTLLQATAEAVARHYRPRDPRPAAIAISAFLTARGVGLPITPGVAPDQPVFPTRMRALAESVERGRALYARRCGACHDATAIAPGAGGFLRTTATSRRSSSSRDTARRPPDPVGQPGHGGPARVSRSLTGRASR